MNFSQKCLELIKKWEGLYLDAYLDPVKIPTIGYGTIRYPNGEAVRLGDRITKQQAEGYLQYECEGIIGRLSSLISVTVTQNQFDAIVSFCFNLGVGAFEDSTLRRELNNGNFAGAANEFDRWVFATENGVKIQFPGLVNRRNDEQALFLSPSLGGSPLNTGSSPQDAVTWLEAYRDGSTTVIVAFNNATVVEILTLANNHKADLISVLQQYKNANNFLLAPVGKAIPPGVRISIDGQVRSINPVATPAVLNRSLLIQGMDDSTSTGNDIRELQQRLQDLGYYKAVIDGIFGKGTDAAVKQFQTDYFSSSEADGKVGQITWDKLWGGTVSTHSTPQTIQSTATKPYLRLTKTNRKDSEGCQILNLQYVKDNQVEDSLEVISGAPGRQVFKTGSGSQSGSFEPLPEGKWFINDIKWAGGKDKYNGTVFAEAEGPVKVPLDYQAPGTTSRSEILFHIDWNRGNGPRTAGTAGCIGLYNIADFKTLVSWLRDTDPRGLYVDWGLGTCPTPT